MVYVLDRDGNPLMPTKRYGKVRHLLKDGKAVVIRKTPFTIRLTYDCGKGRQPVHLGVDAGSRHIGLSAVTDIQEVYSADVEIRQDINKLLATRREARRSRRSRKTRYRKPRFQNRAHSKKKGWLAPSVKAKCDAHITAIKLIMKILPITDITIEMAPFDTQKLKADIEDVKCPKGEDYQHGETEGFDNIKAYVKWRDGYKCAVCGKEHVPLQVHHKKQRHDGGTDIPSNLITVCEECHKAYHAGKLKGSKKAKVMDPDGKTPKLKDAVFMGIMRWAVWDKLKEFRLPLHMTFGYKTAEARRKYDLPKDHRIDARCITGRPDVKPVDEYFIFRKIRCHNRQIHKMKILKGGMKKRNQAPHEIFRYRLFDKVFCKGQSGFIYGRRTSGGFDIRNIEGRSISANITYKKLKLLEPRHNYIIERRPA